jgi:hypothetical protein
MISVNPMEMTWSMLQEDSKFDKSGMMQTLMLERKAHEANQVLGPALPLALRPGQPAIQPAIFLEPGEILERANTLVNMKG